MASYLFLAALVSLGFWLIKLLYLHITKYTFKSYWLKHNQKTATDGELIYVVLGDSTAQGIGAISPKQSFPYLVARWLQKQTGRPVRIINLSLSGAKVQNVIQDQIPQLNRIGPPHIVTVAVGANNIFKFNAESFESQMRTLLMMLPRESYIATVPSFGGFWQSQDWKCVQASQLIEKLVKATNHHTADMYNDTHSHTNVFDYAPDIFHPNARAYKKWAVTFEKAMAQRIPELIQLKK
jgi:acyl-CoA thioesterase-1